MKRLMMILFALASIATAGAQQSGEPFNGILLNFEGAPLKNVKIYTKSPDTYTTTDKKGRFGLTDVKPTDTLKFKIKKQDYFIPVEERKSIVIRLAYSSEYEAKESQDLIDQGYGFVKRREFTGSATRLSGEEFRRQGYTSLSRALQGRVPGLRIGYSGNNQTTMAVRGVNSFNAGTEPLILVDGSEVPDLDSVNIQDVDYVEVLKDSNIYGVRGSAGVILITTIKPGAPKKP